MMWRLALIAAVLPLTAHAQIVSTPADRAGLTLTITQGDLGMVRDRRIITLDKGAGELVIEGVAREARSGTGMVSGVSVRDQGFELEPVSPETLLARSLGREIGIVWKDGQAVERGRVLAAGPVPVFTIDGKVVAGQPARVLFDGLPPGLRALPAWRGAIATDSGGKREVELSYLTGGLSWQADYTAEWAEDKLVLAPWASITNQSGADFADARIRVVAGTVNQVPPQPKLARGDMMMRASAAMAAPSAPEAVGIHHQYALPHPVTLLAGDSRQVALMAPVTLTAERVLVLDPLPPHVWRNQWGEPETRRPMAQLRFKNSTGQPLPAGIVRVSAKAKDGGAVLQGEDRLNGVPDGAAARLNLGEAFDVTARRSQTDFQRIAPDVAEAAWEVTLANGGDRPARVMVREAFGGEWLVIDESDKHVRDGGMGAAWTVTVPAKGETALKYRVRVKG